jgi:hypothetical protein
MKIDKDIPIYKQFGTRAHRINKLALLEVGDSFHEDLPEQDSREIYTRIVNGYKQASYRLGLEIVTRRTEKGVRIWRTK